MTTSPPSATCATCGSTLRPTAVYCRECGATNVAAPLLQQASTAPTTPAVEPASAAAAATADERPSFSHAAAHSARRPRWFLGTFWALVTVGALFAGVVGPAKWLILVALVTGAYSVYLYRGGRYGLFFF